MARGRRLAGVAPLVGSAFAGAALALAGAVALDLFEEERAAATDGPPTVTIRRVADPVRGLAASGASAAGRLTVNEIFERSKPAVVQVNADTVALGSGFVLDKAGHVVTSHRVVAGHDDLRVGFSNRDGVPARLVGFDAATDVAVLRIDAASRSLRALELGRSDSLRVGDAVVAVGNPYGLDRTATAGIVSGLGPPRAGAEGLDDAVHTGAATNATAGGPLLDARARVVGLVTGSGYAVPVDVVRTVAAQLIAGRSVWRAHLGAVVRPVDGALAQVVRLPVESGLLVQEVESGSPAARAGLRAGSTRVVLAGESYVLGGDLIVAVAGQPVAAPGDLRTALEGRRRGDRVPVQVWRGSERRTLVLQLGRRPAG